MKRKIKILFIDILTGDLQLRKTIQTKVYQGRTYAEEMRRFFGIKKNEWNELDGSDLDTNIDLSQYDAIIMGGSTEDPIKGLEKPWMKKIYKIIRQAFKHQIPILGICGGLQFTVRALGGVVIISPKGREFGTVDIVINKDGNKDFLFRDLPKKIQVQSSHKCMVGKIKPGWKVLASSKSCNIQAISIGERIKLLQFHPEMKQNHLKSLGKMREETWIKEGFGKGRGFKYFLSSFKNTEDTGKKIFKNFLDHVVVPYHRKTKKLNPSQSDS